MTMTECSGDNVSPDLSSLCQPCVSVNRHCCVTMTEGSGDNVSPDLSSLCQPCNCLLTGIDV